MVATGKVSSYDDSQAQMNFASRSRSHGRGGDHCGKSERSTLPVQGHPAELNWGFCPGVCAPSEFSLSC